MEPTPGADGGEITLHVNLAQGLLVHARIALIEQMRPDLAAAVGGAAIADVVFCATQDRQRIGQIVALQPAHGCGAQFLDAVRLIGIAFISAAPADIAAARPRTARIPN